MPTTRGEKGKKRIRGVTKGGAKTEIKQQDVLADKTAEDGLMRNDDLLRAGKNGGSLRSFKQREGRSH